MNIDYLIIGQGISGTLLSYELMKAGKKVLVIDVAQPDTASKIASGVINPVTGKKFVTTWMAGTLMRHATICYEELRQLLGRNFLYRRDVLNFHPTQEAATLFEARETEDDAYLHFVNNTDSYASLFHFDYGIGAVNPCYIVEVSNLLHYWRQYLTDQEALLEENFALGDCIVDCNHVLYKNIQASKIIFCQGAADIHNPYFTRLNFQLNKGEAIIARILSLPQDHIYKHGPLSIVPWQDDLFWIGSTFDREYTDELPTEAFRKLVEHTLKGWLKIPYSIVDHLAAIRPATGGQKPFIGLHPLYPSVGIFNGMGSKGCSLAPYFAKQFTNYLLHDTPLNPEADIQRFARILSRS